MKKIIQDHIEIFRALSCPGILAKVAHVPNTHECLFFGELRAHSYWTHEYEFYPDFRYLGQKQWEMSYIARGRIRRHRGTWPAVYKIFLGKINITTRAQFEVFCMEYLSLVDIENLEPGDHA